MTQQVVICCAEEDEPNLAPVMAELHAKGCSPELVPGVDQDPMRLGGIVDAQSQPTMYVFCESEQFRSRVVRQAQGVLGARKGPADDMMVVALAQPAVQIAEKILGSLGQAPERPAPEAERKHLRDVVRLPAKGAKAKAPEAVSAQEAAPSWTGPKGQGGAKDPGARIPGRSAHVPSAAGDEDDLDNVIVPASSSADDELSIDVDEAPKPEAPGGSLRGPLPEPMQTAAPSSRPPSPAPSPERRSYLGTFAWLAVLAAVAGTAWVLMRSDLFSDSEDGGQRGAPVAAAGTEVTNADTAAPKAEAGAGGDTLADSQPAPEGSSEAIKTAVESGELRVLNLLYIAHPDRNEWDYDGAAKYCAELTLGGLPGFRLPGAEELKLVRRSNMLERGRFWSSKGAGEGFAFVLDTEAGLNLVRARKRYRSARPLCVRSH